MIQLIYKTIFVHPHVKYCSQTIYEALLGCIKMYEATNSSIWKKRADHILNILLKIQRPDGGFDIGYEFNFGMLHKKGDSTSPELVGLLAMSYYARVFNEKELVKPYADKAVEWIKRFSVKLDEDTWAIPYSPYTTHEIMVYNGTSFACGALGYYLGVFEVDDSELNCIYAGMINYLESNLFSKKASDGRFWFYPDQRRTDISKDKLNKIDYYHQMQQVEMHSLAQQVSEKPQQLKIIHDCSNHIIEINKNNKVIPYTNSFDSFKGMIHVWGLCSVASGLIEASKLLPEKREKYIEVVKEVIDWLIKYSWNDNYFVPVLTKEGIPARFVEYMVRSDAWVLNSLATYYRDIEQDSAINDIIEKCYRKMENANFSGKESHASSRRKKYISKIVSWLIELKK